jgi:hypothetical protein
MSGSLALSVVLGMAVAGCVSARRMGWSRGELRARRTTKGAASFSSNLHSSMPAARSGDLVLSEELVRVVSEVSHTGGSFCHENRTRISSRLQRAERMRSESLLQLVDANASKTPGVRRSHLDWDDGWLYGLCPEVVEHYRQAPLFVASPKTRSLIALSTREAMSMACLFRVVDLAARRVNATWFVFAGSHVGAAMHGGPIPWDDDADILVELPKMAAFTAALKAFQLPGVTFDVMESRRSRHGEVKLGVKNRGYPTRPAALRNGSLAYQYWPFVDIFFYQVNSTAAGDEIVEIDLKASEDEGLDRWLRNSRGGPSWPISTFFPARTYLFGGLHVPGPSLRVAQRRYDLTRCRMATGNHKLGGRLAGGTLDCCTLARHLPFIHRVPSPIDANVDVELLMQGGRLVHLTRLSRRDGTVLAHAYIRAPSQWAAVGGAQLASSGTQGGGASPSELRHSQLVWMDTYVHAESGAAVELPSVAWNASLAQSTWAEVKAGWQQRTSNATGAELSLRIPDLDFVEIDNTIAPGGCRPPFQASAEDGSTRARDEKSPRLRHRGAAPLPAARSNTSTLAVAGVNAERGGSWPLLAHLLRTHPRLRQADVVFLNEMDIGMARTRNEHTTRLLAHALGMNYAWGLEFVELTRGNKGEQQATAGSADALGLHGNAILTRCRISNATVVRGPFDERYFAGMSAPSGTNAQGYEVRLGGRMGLFASVELSRDDAPRRTATLGAVHKLEGAGSEVRLRRLLSASGGAAIAGDQNPQLCDMLGLHQAVPKQARATFPASCKSFGRKIGDIICTDQPRKAEEGRRGSVEVELPCATWFDRRVALGDHAITFQQTSIRVG